MVKSEQMALMTMLATITMVPMNESWLYLWMLMEINMASMALILMNEDTKEKTMVFFLFQSFPSLAILLAILISWLPLNEPINPTSMSVIVVAMVCKMGLFPLHSWIMKLSKTMSWTNNMIMMSIQKIIPLMLLMKISELMIMSAFALASLVVMTILLIYTTNTKMFLMTSSMAHMSWMIMSIMKFKLASLIYLLAYSVILLFIVNHCKKSNNGSLMSQKGKKYMNQVSLKINLMSLSGMPPLVGFALKALVIYLLVIFMTPIKMVTALLMAATGAFYAYSQLIVKTLVMKMHTKKTKEDLKAKNSKKMALWNILTPTMILIK